MFFLGAFSRTLFVVHFLAFFLFFTLECLALSGDSDVRIVSWGARLSVMEDSSVLVRETLHIHFSDSSQDGERFLRRFVRGTALDANGNLIRLELSDFKAWFNGKRLDVGLGSHELQKPVAFPVHLKSVTFPIHLNDRLNQSSEFVLEYRVNGLLNYLEDIDSLVWDTADNTNDLPVESISLEVILPETTKLLGFKIDSSRESANNFYVAYNDGNRLLIRNKFSLSPDESFKLYIKWPEGYIMRKTKEVFLVSTQRYMWTAGLLVGVVITLFIIAFIARKLQVDKIK